MDPHPSCDSTSALALLLSNNRTTVRNRGVAATTSNKKANAEQEVSATKAAERAQVKWRRDRKYPVSIPHYNGWWTIMII